MANTIIQIKRSSVTAVPLSLDPGELAYSFSSDKVFIGNNTNEAIAIGGKAFVDYQNTLTVAVGSAYDKANSANLLAYNVGIGSNAWTNTVFDYANTSIAAANGWANTVAAGANGWANAIGVTANSYADIVGVSANTYANNTFLKLTGGTINGDLAVSGNLVITGNTAFVNVSTYRVDDPLIYLAGNNYISDIVDIGFVANYVNTSGYNVHTGFFRDAGSKEYYVFEGYDEEPHNNVIDPNGNNFTIAVLNATLKSSNIMLNGANLWSWINSAYTQANAAPGIANSYADMVGAAANGWANTVAAGANSWTNTVFGYANTSIAAANGWANTVGVSANAYAAAVGVAANTYADGVGTAANTNAANASYLSVGTVPSARISGSYTGITGVGTIATGTWNADTITVPYGGTGMTSFTANGILYGNTTGAIKVTAAGTDGQVLQSDQGLPKFSMLDGGIF